MTWTLLAVAGLPVVAALLLLALRRVPVVPAALASLALAAVAALAVHQADAAPLMILGRSVGLSPLSAAGLSYCALLMAAATLHAESPAVGAASRATMLAAMASFAAAVMVRNLTISGLLLAIGAVFAVILVPSGRADLSLVGSRALSVVTLAVPLLLFAVRSLEMPGGLSRGGVQGGVVAVAAAVCLALAVFPFHVWVTPLYRRGSVQAVVMLGVVLGVVALTYLRNLTQALAGEQMQQHLAALLGYAGLASAIYGGLAASAQRSLGGLLAYAALADLGVALLGLGSATDAGTAAAALHVAYRGVAVAAGAMALGVFRQHLGGDDDHHLRGAVHRAPLAVLGSTLAILSLVGLPLTAGFSTRAVLYPLAVATHRGWGVALLLAGAGPLWAAARLLRVAYAPTTVPPARVEPLVSGLLILGLGALLVVLGLLPGLLPLEGAGWLLPQPAAAALLTGR